MSSVGAEVNPAAAILARVYEWVNRARSDRQEALRTVGRDVDRLCAVAEAAQFGENGPVVSTRRVAEMALTMETETRQLFEALLVLSDPTSESVDVGRFIAAWKRLREVLLGLPYSDRPVKVFDADARELPIADGTIDLVVTSPPYINVFNYHQQYRPAVEALGFDVLIAARSEIGSNRKHRSNRFLTAIQYCLDLSQVLGELKRVCAVGSRMILVLGRESRVRGTAIQNGDLLCSLATDAAGLGIITRQERCFTNRYGERIVEDILHFRSNAEPMTCDLETPRQIAVEALERAVLTAPAEASEDIAQAIEFASTVEPSPRYRSPTLRHNRVAPIDANPHASLG